MRITYDLNTNGCLIIRASSFERDWLSTLRSESGEFTAASELDALEPTLCNSELEWIDPSETGDLTDAPMLGLHNDDGEVEARWAYMDYQVRSFIQDLINTGKAVFVS